MWRTHTQGEARSEYRAVDEHRSAWRSFRSYLEYIEGTHADQVLLLYGTDRILS